MTRTEPPKARRQGRIIELIEQQPITSQAELARILADDGWDVTQPTISRDLVELRAVRVRGADGVISYALPADGAFDPPEPSERLTKLCQELLLRAEASGNLVIAKTPAGAAQYLASALDKAGWPDVLGCVAGDDTVMIVARQTDGGTEIADRLLALGSERDS